MPLKLSREVMTSSQTVQANLEIFWIKTGLNCIILYSYIKIKSHITSSTALILAQFEKIKINTSNTHFFLISGFT